MEEPQEPEPMPEAEVPEAKEVVEVPEVPEEPKEVVVPKRRGRPPGAKNKPKLVAVEKAAEAAEAADYEPRQEDVALATRYFARHLGQMSQMSLDAKRARWRELFM